MNKIFTSETPIISHALFGHSPFTDKVSPTQFNELLKMTHEALNINRVQNKIEQRLKPYAGPQCHEDRGKVNLLNYDVDFRVKIRNDQEIPNQKSQVVSQTLSVPSQNTLLQTIQPNNNNFVKCNFRVCFSCKKTRLLDERASKCFPLGTYNYSNKKNRPKFQCAMLVDITCSTKEDIEQLPLPNDIPSSWLIVEISYESSTPTCAVIVESTGTYTDIADSDRILNVNILHRYFYKNHSFSSIESPMLVKWKTTGTSVLGSEQRRGFTPISKNLMAYQFTVSEGREAKCCQNWFDPILDINDPNEIIGIQKISTIKQLHSIMNTLKIIKCLMCKRQLPGFDTPFSELQTLERGQYINLRNNDYVKALNNSEVLCKSIKLVQKFKDCKQAESNRKFALVYVTNALLIMKWTQIVT